MSRAEYDRARAEYIKSHTRAERLRLAWLMAAYVHRNRSTKPRVSYSKGFHGTELRNAGYDLDQVNALCASINAGLTCPTLQRFSLYASRIFYHLFRYVSKRIDSGDFDVEFCEESYCMPYAPKEHHCATLRAAFREVEHALITLPRTPKHLNE